MRDVRNRYAENRNYSVGSIILNTLEWEKMVGKNTPKKSTVAQAGVAQLVGCHPVH